MLEVGPQRYRLQLQGDLSLRVVGDKGKASKTLPALKDESLRLQWNAAQAEFKTVASGVKAIAKQQVPRLSTAFMTGQRWSVPRWRRLFLQHPLLRIVGRSLIWRLEQGASFRIAEDFSLLNAADDAVELSTTRRCCSGIRSMPRRARPRPGAPACPTTRCSR
jgi:hypothetical protein